MVSKALELLCFAALALDSAILAALITALVWP
jgi:hypothetical protein